MGARMESEKGRRPAVGQLRCPDRKRRRFSGALAYLRPMRPSAKMRASMSLGPPASILGVKPIWSRPVLYVDARRHFGEVHPVAPQLKDGALGDVHDRLPGLVGVRAEK